MTAPLIRPETVDLSGLTPEQRDMVKRAALRAMEREAQRLRDEDAKLLRWKARFSVAPEHPGIAASEAD